MEKQTCVKGENEAAEAGENNVWRRKGCRGGGGEERCGGEKDAAEAGENNGVWRGEEG
ncbi:hypothetical protein DEO72_LG6g2540 [Vigna unguiculata]|uniref:Uncharacterized protein n=1 Tax=Vigna unguiculata TaxID=3917 RepID=A0A4D6MA09_VIGUN|nr:hypothetical protein DEO72_LG6g2540 [Vigna unguiculata]